VIQSEAQLHAVYGLELAEAFIDNHRARVYYRPPVHRRDLAEQISNIFGQKTVKQTRFSYTDNKRSRQVSKTGQAILDADEIANLRDHETIVLVEGGPAPGGAETALVPGPELQAPRPPGPAAAGAAAHGAARRPEGHDPPRRRGGRGRRRHHRARNTHRDPALPLSRGGAAGHGRH
jgi:hypothetical protein